MMQLQLDRESFQRARDFILSKARPLEQAQFRMHFESGSAAAVVDALAQFQNADGGFGNALEPDIRLPQSSPMVSSEACAILRELDSSSGTPLRRKAVQYLLDTYDPERPGWRDVPPEVNDHPHAPWWQRKEAAQAGPEGVWGNPDADLIAALHDHAPMVPPSLLKEMTEIALAKLASAPEVPSYVARCYLRLAKAAPSASHEIHERLCRDANQILDQIDGNSLQPFWLAESPEGSFAKATESKVKESLDAEIGRQSPDGSWKPRWTWFGNYPEGWKVAEREWSGQQTLMTLRSLRAWGRIAGGDH